MTSRMTQTVGRARDRTSGATAALRLRKEPRGAEHGTHARLLSSLHVFKDEKKPKPLEDGLLGVPETYGGGRDRAGGRDGSPTPLNVLCFAVYLWNT